jgi:hypothetical protein
MSKALCVRRSFSVKVVQSALLMVLLVALSVNRLISDLQSRLVFWNKLGKHSKGPEVARQDEVMPPAISLTQRPATSDAPGRGADAGTPGS